MPDRNQFISAIERREHLRALGLMRQLFNEAPTLASAQFV